MPRASLFAWLRVYESFLATYVQDEHLIGSEYATSAFRGKKWAETLVLTSLWIDGRPRCSQDRSSPFLGHAIEHIHFEASDSPRLVHGTISPTVSQVWEAQNCVA